MKLRHDPCGYELILLVECELLLDDRLVHLPDRSQVFGAVAGDCVYKALLDLFKFVKKKFKNTKKSKNLVDDCGF